jgi:hypothetical protein
MCVSQLRGKHSINATVLVILGSSLGLVLVIVDFVAATRKKMALFSVFTVLVGVLLLLSGVEAGQINKTSEQKVQAFSPFIRRFMNISSTNPLAIKTTSGAENNGLRGAEGPIHAESEDRMYVTFQYFSDSACTNMMLSSSQQLNKCFMAGWQGSNGVVTPTYYYNTLMSSGDKYTLSSTGYSGHCKSHGALKTPLYTDTASFPMTCTPVGTMWGMTVITASIPTFPSAEGAVFK